MPSGARRFALQQLDRAAKGITDLPTATVTAVTVGGGTDGADLVTVNYQGASLGFPHLSAYTPSVGHVVVLARAGGDWMILGRLVGFPPS